MKTARFHRRLTLGLAFSFILSSLYSIYQENSESKKTAKSSSVIEDISKIELSSEDKKEREIILKKAQPSDNKKKGEAAVIMSDPAMSQKWGLHKTDVRRAWNVSQGSREIVVAVIDTGIDVNHPDIKANLWINKGETGKDAKGRDKSKNGIDDDRNGCIDDVHGCNMITLQGDLTDNHGHGTHIAGIIGAVGGNGVGISGVAPEVSLMILKYYDPKAPGANNLLNTVKGIHYAVAMKKAHKIKRMIINYSGGGLEHSRDEFLAIEMARKEGILFVAAAGNERSNSDKSKYYPASYDLSNIISVTAVNPDTKVLASSNYGIHTVDIAAPGENIYSTLPKNSYGLMTGTSQATAFATGVAALVMANNQEFSYHEVKKYILRTGDDIPALRQKTGTSKRLNSYRALVTLDQGVSATGAIAENTIDMKPDHFSTENIQRSLSNTGSSSGMALFGQNLVKALAKEEQ